MNKLTDKEVHTLAGEMSAACCIINEVLKALYYAERSPATQHAIIAARDAADKARTALRAVSYEIENVA